MQVSRNRAISTAVAAAVVVVVLVVVGVGVYYATQSGGSTTTTTTTTTTTSPTKTTTTATTTATTTTTTTTTTSRSTSSSFTYYPQTIQSGGSTFVNPVMQVWTVAFNQFTGGSVNVNYQAIGSGGGITGVTTGTFAFAGSDAPFANSTAAKGTLLNIPESLGAVAIFYNLPGIKTSINLTGSIIADIYLQKITKWNDTAILNVNSKLSHNNTALAILAHVIVPVHRQDSSGTTFALTTFFSRVSTDWNASKLGVGTKVNWPNSPNPELQGKGSGGVAAYVQQTHYSIGYADSYYAFSNNILTAAIQNKAGFFLTPSLAGVTAAAAAFNAQLQANPAYSITNAPGATSYPISTFTYVLVYSKQSNQQVGADVALFIWWIVTSGQQYGPKLYYPTLPPSMVTIDEGLIAQITYNGVPFIT